MIPDTFIEFYYGKYVELDLHNMIKEDAKAALIYELGRVDADIKCLVVVHGYHGGTVRYSCISTRSRNFQQGCF